MLATMILAAVFSGLVVGHVILWAVFLGIGVRWAKVEGVTTRRIVVVTVLVFAAQLVMSILIHLRSAVASETLIGLRALDLVAGVLVPYVIIARAFQTRYLVALRAWLPTLLSTIVVVLVTHFVVRPYLFEVFVQESGAMAPTLLPGHWRSVCSQCGANNYCTAIGPQIGRLGPQQMICENFHVSDNMNVASRTYPGDRFVVAKFPSPERWDVVLFRFPKEPSVSYVMRVAGLPGETITIDDGVVWANGKKLMLLESVGPIQYLSSVPGSYAQPWGSPSRPAVLGDDEYFVLGDFSAAANDSRLWEEGAPSRPPFAVPRSHVLGVVTHIYWPPKRWRTFR